MEKLQRAQIVDNPSGINIGISNEFWKNDLYTVRVYRGIKVPNMVKRKGKPLTVCWLSIKRNDKTPVMDWRHMQWIKNQLVGPECEGCELFPAESRLVDAANQYHMWVFENPAFRFPFGFPDRHVTESSIIEGAVQRPFPDDRKPVDLEEGEQRLRELIEQRKGKPYGS